MAQRLEEAPRLVSSTTLGVKNWWVECARYLLHWWQMWQKPAAAVGHSL